MLRFKQYLDLQERIKFNALKPTDLFRRNKEVRANLLLKKVSDNDIFLTYPDGKEVKISAKKSDIKKLKQIINSKDSKALKNFTFISINGKEYKISDFAKSGEFGGRGAGSGTAAEDEALSDLKEKFSKILTSKTLPYIFVKVNKKIVEVADIQSTFGTPKSDFHFLDSLGKEVAWISHKKGSSPKDFQQYAGLSEVKKALPSKDLDNFIDAIKNYMKENNLTSFPSKTKFLREIKDKKIIGLALYGKDFKASGPSGRNNINVLYQGFMNFKLIKKEDNNNIPTYEITSNHTMYHGEDPTGGYEAVYSIRYQGDRSDQRIENSRLMIFSRGGLASTVKEI
jgi:hypothetical protein